MAGRKPGGPKFGGRVAGTPNNRTKSLVERIAESGKSPLDVLLEFLEHKDDHLRISAAKELMQYEWPKRKAIEVSGQLARPRVLEITGPNGQGVRIVSDEENE